MRRLLVSAENIELWFWKWHETYEVLDIAAAATFFSILDPSQKVHSNPGYFSIIYVLFKNNCVCFPFANCCLIKKHFNVPHHPRSGLCDRNGGYMIKFDICCLYVRLIFERERGGIPLGLTWK